MITFSFVTIYDKIALIKYGCINTTAMNGNTINPEVKKDLLCNVYNAYPKCGCLLYINAVFISFFQLFNIKSYTYSDS